MKFFRRFRRRTLFGRNSFSKSNASSGFFGSPSSRPRRSRRGTNFVTARDGMREEQFTRRAIMIGGFQALLFSSLAARLFYLSVIDSSRYSTLADVNRVGLKLLIPPRGRIFDRYGEKLAINRLNYRVMLVREQAGDVAATLDALSLLIEVTDSDRQRVLHEIENKRSFVPVMVRENLNWEEVSRVELNVPDLPGLTIDVGQLRHFPHTFAVGHILGYVGAVSESDQAALGGDDPLLELPDFRIGKNGVERYYDPQLRGTAGASRIEVNSVGRAVRELSRIEAVPGHDLQLNIDIGLQEYGNLLVGDQSASVVLMDVKSGGILTMISAPAFDPNVFSSGVSPQVWNELISNPKHPLTNKSTSGLYAPGSTFKIVTAMAGLENGAITESTEMACPGHYDLGDSRFHCWRRGGHGIVNLQRALKESCDVFFYETARRVGIDKLGETARKFGFGKAVGIDMPSERGGLVPTRNWKQANYGIQWMQGDSVTAGIGQSFLQVTPLQLAVMMARLVNGGKAVTPRLKRQLIPNQAKNGGASPNHIGKEMVGQYDALKSTKISEADKAGGQFADLGFDPNHVQAVMRGLIAATNEPNGTAYAARITDAGMEMGGKTGSAQVRRISKYERERGIRPQESIPWEQRDNALFVAFAPIDAPRYACSVVVEHGIHGSWAAPIARDLLRQAMLRDKLLAGLGHEQPTPNNDGDDANPKPVTPPVAAPAPAFSPPISAPNGNDAVE
ncbi:MAG: penicillin-binding protein 2 [Candidatus Symbiobacter sp.]|nr:penicillin-binding protein 2 [Candidatus Symbiobacter sp.]